MAALSIVASACGTNAVDDCAAAAMRCDAAQEDRPATRDGTDASALPVLGLPGRIHLVNRGAVDVYLGLRFADRCAFDYVLSGPDPAADGGSGGAPLVIEPPACPCHPACDGCVGTACATQSCSELCDELPPRLAPGGERILAWDGSTFHYLTVCGGARCAEAAAALPGAYDLSIPIFDRAVAPDSGVAPVVTIKAGFLISSGGAGDTDVEIPIAL